MGRVYEALKRAAEQNGAKGNGGGEATSSSSLNGTKSIAPVAGANGRNGSHAPEESAVASHRADAGTPELFLRQTKHFQSPETAHTSASTEHTETSGGSALPTGQASRAAGATLGAGGSARTPEFVSIDISAARVEPHLVAITQPRSGHAERFRSLRTRLLHAGERKKMHSFVITSAGAMEGKTLTAINLSWLLAQTDGVSALLIDGDLRNPCVADYLGLDAPSGLSEVLAGEATLEESIVRLEPAGLHLLPGGTARDDVAEILSGPKFHAVLREASRMFDYVIIDAPPLGIFTDAAVLINRADGALIVARAGKTRCAALERLLEPLPRERILGVILNGSDEQMTEQNYYYRRYSARRTMEGTREELPVEKKNES
ncbi:MAG: CpsD/CapB family tyrosine-protein kinase [Rubrivivax sp.]|nr:CpsD/CapB family tyrosine-protein kinase [Pyrinomonadaceae bacterium]